MTSMIVKAGVAALISLTGLSAAAPTAAAGPDLTIQVQYRDYDRDWRPDRGPRGCSPWLAEEKASRMGLRRARVVDAGRRVVVVAGFGYRGPERILFANERGCPVIRR